MSSTELKITKFMLSNLDNTNNLDSLLNQLTNLAKYVRQIEQEENIKISLKTITVDNSLVNALISSIIDSLKERISEEQLNDIFNKDILPLIEYYLKYNKIEYKGLRLTKEENFIQNNKFRSNFEGKYQRHFQRVFSTLPTSTKKIIRYYFGENFRNKPKEPITSYHLDIIKKSIHLLRTRLETEFTSNIYNLLKRYSKEEIKTAISKLPKEDQQRIYNVYGEYLNSKQGEDPYIEETLIPIIIIYIKEERQIKHAELKNGGIKNDNTK